MRKLFAICTIMFSASYYCQKNNCELKIDFDSATTQNDGNIKILVKNIGSVKTKILKKLHPYKAQILNASIYSSKEHKYIPQNYSTADIDFFSPEKTEKIKPNETKVYVINIFDTYQGQEFLNKSNSYHFDLFFDFVSLVDYKNKCTITGNEKVKNLQYYGK